MAMIRLSTDPLFINMIHLYPFISFYIHFWFVFQGEKVTFLSSEQYLLDFFHERIYSLGPRVAACGAMLPFFRNFGCVHRPCPKLYINVLSSSHHSHPRHPRHRFLVIIIPNHTHCRCYHCHHCHHRRHCRCHRGHGQGCFHRYHFLESPDTIIITTTIFGSPTHLLC